MSIDTLKNSIPDYAKDIKLNLSSLAADETLNTQQLWGTFLASALATQNEFVISQIEDVAKENLSPEAMQGTKAAAAIMAMNNVNIIANPGVDKKDFELWSLAVSAINACGMCIDAHEAQLIKEGVSKDEIQTAVRIAATIHAVSAVLSGEQAMNETSMSQAA